MPLLDFVCNECDKKFDELTSLNRRHEVKCPFCGAKDVKQIYEGKCYFGTIGGSGGGASSGGCSGRSCSGCSGCHS